MNSKQRRKQHRDPTALAIRGDYSRDKFICLICETKTTRITSLLPNNKSEYCTKCRHWFTVLDSFEEDLQFKQ